ncbi:MAG: DUF1036 domain-containing protein [Synergistaceae bacterium]|nr:DUF1036 domain-containing protein [Synergistaceae bacterium]
MKRKLGIFAVLFLVGVGFCAVSPRAEAVQITFDNYRDQKVAAALIYYDVNQSSWCCQGWWIVEPLGERTINVPHHPDERIYYHVQSGGKVVHNRSEGWARWDVINNAFKYYEHDGCPNGKDYRSVYFNCSSNVTGHSWRLNIN